MQKQFSRFGFIFCSLLSAGIISPTLVWAKDLPFDLLDARLANASTDLYHIINDKQFLQKDEKKTKDFVDRPDGKFQFDLDRNGNDATIVADRKPVATPDGSARVYIYHFDLTAKTNKVPFGIKLGCLRAPNQWFKVAIEHLKVSVTSSLTGAKICVHDVTLGGLVTNMETYIQGAVDKLVTDQDAEEKKTLAKAETDAKALADARAKEARDQAAQAKLAALNPLIAPHVAPHSNPLRPPIHHSVATSVKVTTAPKHAAPPKKLVSVIKEPATESKISLTQSPAPKLSSVQLTKLASPPAQPSSNQFFSEAKRTPAWTDTSTGITINGRYQIKDGSQTELVTVHNLFKEFAQIVDPQGREKFVQLNALKSKIISTDSDPSQSDVNAKADKLASPPSQPVSPVIGDGSIVAD